MKFLVILLCVFAPNFSSAFTAGEYLKQKDAINKSEYIDGIGSGISWANAWFEVTHGKKMYCPPSKMVMNGSNYIDFLNREIDFRMKNEPKTFMNEPIEFLLIEHLRKVFPCR